MLTRVPRHTQVLLLATAVFAAYALCRVHVVSGCDSYAYYAESYFLRGADPGGLFSFPDAQRHPALAPFCIEPGPRGYASVFPPGFSLLLAIAGVLGAEYWLNPLFGALSVVLIH